MELSDFDFTWAVLNLSLDDVDVSVFDGDQFSLFDQL